jgi:charged multivesicular body protein 2A
MADAMKGVTKALVKINQKINLPGLQKVMAEFMKENERAEMTQEMIGDTIDDALEEDGTADQEDAIVNQVLDELGVGVVDASLTAPLGNKAGAVESPAEGKSPSPDLTQPCLIFSYLTQMPL